MAVAWCGRWHCHCVAADIAIAIAIFCAFLLLPQRAIAFHVMQHCTSCHCIGGCLARCAMAFLCHAKGCCGDALGTTAMCFVPRHCTSCHSMVLCAAALHFMLQHFCAMVLCFVPRRFAGVEAFCFVQRHCALHCSIGSGIACRVTAPAPLSFVEKKKNNQPAVLVEEWLGSNATRSVGLEDLGMHLHPLTPDTIKLKKSTCSIGKCFSGCSPSTCIKIKFENKQRAALVVAILWWQCC